MSAALCRSFVKLSLVFRRLFFLLIFIVAAPGCSKKTADPAQAVNAFFELLRKGDPHAAYESAAFAFQAQQSASNFEATVADLGLSDFAAINWTRRVTKEKEASLDGEITTRAGAKVPLAVTLLREGGGWKLYALHTTGGAGPLPTENRFSLVGKGAAFTDGFDKNLPPMPAMVDLVRSTLLDFNAAIQNKNFGDFYRSISNKWQSQLSEKRLERAFQPFIDSGMDFGEIRDGAPVFDQKPRINSEGLLVASGYFPAKQFRVVFSLKYLYELPKWKLFGIDLNLVK